MEEKKLLSSLASEVALENHRLLPRISQLEVELLEGRAFLNVLDAYTELFDSIEIDYNRVRKHSSLGYKSSEQVENE